MPTTHTYTINQERIVLIACIMGGMSVNIGKVIEREIRLCANKRVGKLYFPTLILMFHRIAEVDTSLDDDSELYNGGMIASYDLSRILPPPSLEETTPTLPARDNPVDQDFRLLFSPMLEHTLTLELHLKLILHTN